jgi:hypothetical protein
MTDQQPWSIEDIDLAVNEVESHSNSAALGLLALDALCHQAERRNLNLTKKFIKQRARHHKLERSDAQTEAGNVIAIFERGPLAHFERALLVAFAVFGFGVSASKLDDSERQEAIKEFIAHADWFEMCSDYRIYCFIDRLLDGRLLKAIYDCMARLILEQEAQGRASEPAVRARNAVRLTALTRAKPAMSEEALQQVAQSTKDPYTRAILSSEAAGFVPVEAVRIHGIVAHVPEGLIRMGIRWVSGWALLNWLFRMILKTIGYRHQIEFILSEDSLSIERRVTVLSRLIRSAQEVTRVSAIESGARYIRYPALHLLIGALSLTFGILMGGMFLFDGVFAGDSALLLAAFVVLLGAGLDLALDTVMPSRAGQVSIEVRIAKRKKIQLAGVPVDSADRFIERFRQRLEQAASAKVITPLP